MQQIVRLSAPFAGYRRGGRAHRVGQAEFPIESFDREQLKAVLADPRLAAEIITVPAAQPDVALLGSGFLPALNDMPDGSQVQLGYVVQRAHTRSGLSADEWNALRSDEREHHLSETLALMRALEATEMELAVAGSGKAAMERLYPLISSNTPEGRSGTAREAPSADSGDDALQAPSGTQSAAPHAFTDPDAPASDEADADQDDAGEAVDDGESRDDAGQEAGAESEAAPASDPEPEPEPKPEPVKAPTRKRHKKAS